MKICDDCALKKKCDRSMLVCPDKVPADPLSDFRIITDPDKYAFCLGKVEVQGKTLRGCLLALGRSQNWGIDAGSILRTLRAMPEGDNRDLLLGILETA